MFGGEDWWLVVGGWWLRGRLSDLEATAREEVEQRLHLLILSQIMHTCRVKVGVTKVRGEEQFWCSADRSRRKPMLVIVVVVVSVVEFVFSVVGWVWGCGHAVPKTKQPRTVPLSHALRITQPPTGFEFEILFTEHMGTASELLSLLQHDALRVDTQGWRMGMVDEKGITDTDGPQ